MARVSSDGGPIEYITDLDAEKREQAGNVHMLPGGRYLLYSVRLLGDGWSTAEIRAYDVRSGESHVVTANALGPERQEVAILRVAARLNAPYEWAHHVDRAGKIGMSKDRIESIAGDPEGMSHEDALIAGAVDSLIDDTRLSSTQVADLQEAVDLEGILDLMATV